MLSIRFEPACGGASDGLASEAWALVHALPGPRVVLVDGHFRADLSVTAAGRGIVVDSLCRVLRDSPGLLAPHLAHYAPWREHPFVALNTGLATEGVFVQLAAGAVQEEPVHLVHLWTAAGKARVAHPRALILAEPNSRAAIVESYWGSHGSVSLTNAVTEIVVGRGAVLEHAKLQEEGDEAFHMATVQVHQQSRSSFTSHVVFLGGSLARNEINIRLEGRRCRCTLNGLYWARGRQHMDLRTRIDHAQPACASEELYKGILDERARGVFNGKIYVHRAAQQTDAKQTNRALVLSDQARVNTKPQLEIFADDVRCTHGATVGQIEPEAMFYLRSRGIAERRARQLLIWAFANDVVGRIGLAPLRTAVEQLLTAGDGLSVGPVAGRLP